MGKEFSGDKLGKTEFQPVISVKDNVEAVATGMSSGSTDAMETVPNVNDKFVESGKNEWKDTTYVDNASGGYDEKTFTYSSMPMSMANVTNTKGRQVAADGNWPDYSKVENVIPMNWGGGTVNTTAVDDPKNGVYKKDKYKTKVPIKMADATEVPAFDRLVSKDEKGTEIEALQGTLQFPNLNSEIDQSTLFIGGTPVVDDVHQGNLDDCYFLASVLQVLHYNPSKIVNMMNLAGDQVTTKFYYKKDDKWNPVTITTKLGLINRDAETMGAFVRIANNPKSAVWSTSIDGSVLKISKEQYYEAAMWVNCLEQAFAVFAQTYGRHGLGTDEPTVASHNGICESEYYNKINYGMGSGCLNMFFGEDAGARSGSNTVVPASNNDLAQANRSVISTLLNLAKSQDKKGTEDVYISAGTTPDVAVSRLDNLYTSLRAELDTACKAAPDNEELQASSTALNYFKKNFDLYKKGTDKTAADKMNDASKTLLENASFQRAALPSYRLFRTVLGTVLQRFNDNVFMFSSHAYNVSTVQLIGKSKENLNYSDLNTVINSIDVTKSTVVMQNPYGTGKATFNKPEERAAQGDFEVKLDEFLTNVGFVNSVSVKHNSKK